MQGVSKTPYLHFTDLENEIENASPRDSLGLPIMLRKWKYRREFGTTILGCFLESFRAKKKAKILLKPTKNSTLSLLKITKNDLEQVVLWQHNIHKLFYKKSEHEKGD